MHPLLLCICRQRHAVWLSCAWSSSVYVCSLAHCCCRRTQKLVEQALLEIAAPGPPRINTRNVCGNFLALRGEVIQLVEARQAAAKRQADAKKAKRQRADDAAAAPRQEKRQRVAKRYD